MVVLVAALEPAAKEPVMNPVVKEVVGNVIYIDNRVRAERHAASEPRGPAPQRRRAPEAETPAEKRSIDDKLVEQIVMGDLVAAERLKRRHQRHLLALAIYVLRDEAEAHAAMEAAFMDASIGWPPQRGHVKPWLRRLVRRRAWAMRAERLDRS
jgi:hypothetical protein